MNCFNFAKKIAESLESIPVVWDGRESILEMKEKGDKNWRQMEWIGFYFQFLCGKYLADAMIIPAGEKASYGNVEFDGFKEIPWDFKAHALNTSSHQIIVNDSEAITEAIKQYDAVGVVLALGEVAYNDEKRTFQKWHEELKGGLSDYSKERISRGAWSRLRKTRFNLKQICFVEIDEKLLRNAGSFQRNFRNADGSPRREKILLDLEEIDDGVVYSIDFA